MVKRNIFIAGPPGCGKTTLIEKVVSRIKGPVTGFFTLEIKKEGTRKGFCINTLDGNKGILAHQDRKSQYRVGKYGVNLKDIEAIAVPSIIPARREEIVVIDEIGKMECFSLQFRKTLIKVLDLPNWVVASIAQKGELFIQGIKQRDDVTVMSITKQNRNILVDQILELLQITYQDY